MYNDDYLHALKRSETNNSIQTEELQSSPCMHLTKLLISRAPLLFLVIPTMAVYAITRSSKMLDIYYMLRSLLYAIPRKHGLRVSKTSDVLIYYPVIEDPFFVDVWIRNVYGLYKPDPNDVVFDVGAYMGFFTVKIAKHVRKVVAFEPDPYNLRYLLLNVRINNLTNVDIYRLALGEKQGAIYLKRGYGGGRTEITEQPTPVKTYMTTIDNFVSTYGSEPTVIKIDTEGYEINILKGAKNTLMRYKPKLIIAAYHYPEEILDVVSLLSRLRYKCLIYWIPLLFQKKREVYVFAYPH